MYLSHSWLLSWAKKAKKANDQKIGKWKVAWFILNDSRHYWEEMSKSKKTTQFQIKVITVLHLVKIIFLKFFETFRSLERGSRVCLSIWCDSTILRDLWSWWKCVKYKRYVSFSLSSKRIREFVMCMQFIEKIPVKSILK